MRDESRDRTAMLVVRIWETDGAAPSFVARVTATSDVERPDEQVSTVRDEASLRRLVVAWLEAILADETASSRDDVGR